MPDFDRAAAFYRDALGPGLVAAGAEEVAPPATTPRGTATGACGRRTGCG
ncbi:MAG TPA: hypothetical protein VFB42_09260 [Gaiellaceae bacterium]|nr:hypothetical protein [Gaiellaceae bacterium]